MGIRDRLRLAPRQVTAAAQLVPTKIPANPWQINKKVKPDTNIGSAKLIKPIIPLMNISDLQLTSKINKVDSVIARATPPKKTPPSHKGVV